MALPRFEKLTADRRHRLIAAAAMEFAAKGYQGAALVSIAEKSGIGKSSFYYYFVDKADLCATVLQEAWRALRADTRLKLESVTKETFWPSLEALVRDNLERCRREPWLRAAAKLLNRTPADPSGATVLDDYHEKRREFEVAFVERGRALGAIRTDLPTDLLVTMSLSVRQASNLWLLERMESGLTVDEGDRLALQVQATLRQLLSPPAADADETQSEDVPA